MRSKYTFKSKNSLVDICKNIKAKEIFRTAKFNLENDKILINNGLDEVLISQIDDLIHVEIQCSQIEETETRIVFIFGYIISSVLLMLDILIWKSWFLFVLLIVIIFSTWLINKFYNKLQFLDTTNPEIYKNEILKSL